MCSLTIYPYVRATSATTACTCTRVPGASGGQQNYENKTEKKNNSHNIITIISRHRSCNMTHICVMVDVHVLECTSHTHEISSFIATIRTYNVYYT